jgi:HEAT repeat protein
MVAAREMSPMANATAGWFRLLARGLKVFRLYRPENPIVTLTQDNLANGLAGLLQDHGALQLHFAPNEIRLGDEVIVRAGQNSGEIGNAALDLLPFLFYRDGVRHMRILPGTPRGEMDLWFDALRMAGAGPASNDDLVTLLWQANLSHIQTESVPYEQTIYLSSRPSGARRGGSSRAQTFVATPEGEEIRAEIGQITGPQGLHKDTFDDWALPSDRVEVPAAWEKLKAASAPARARLIKEWEAELATPWTVKAPMVLKRVRTLLPGDESRAAVGHALATWLGTAIVNGTWEEAEQALALLRLTDPGLEVCGRELDASLEGIDKAEIAERLDEATAEEHARFAALAVGLGPHAVDLLTGILGNASRSRTRAAASTALSFLCQEQPELLAPYLQDSRWFLVRNLVFVLGQIGGTEVAGLLRTAALHPEPRVRRQVVQALGSVPRAERLPILFAQLDSQDGQLLAAALAMLMREKDRQVARALLDRIEAPDFESRPEAIRRSLFGALAEVADDAAVPALEALLHRGGWFARRTLERVAAARVLQKIGTEKALAALEAGLRSRNDAVRAAALDALDARGNG